MLEIRLTILRLIMLSWCKNIVTSFDEFNNSLSLSVINQECTQFVIAPFLSHACGLYFVSARECRPGNF